MNRSRFVEKLNKVDGNRIESYVLSTPGMTPWKKAVRVYGDVSEVCLSYETEGDAAEASLTEPAEAVSRNHDSTCQKKRAVTWNDLKGGA